MLGKLLPKNEGVVDRLIRVLAGAALLALVFVGPKTPLGWIGVLPLLTGLVGSCPVYTLFGLRTCPLESENPSAT